MSNSNLISKRIAQIRAIMKKRKIDAFLIPHEDERLCENTPKNYERLFWLTGFSGSAGYALITTDNLYLFVDGRYTLQAKKQTKKLKAKIIDIDEKNLVKLLKNNSKKIKKLALDPKLISALKYNKLITHTNSAKIKVLNVKTNLIDLIWKRELKIQKTNRIFILKKIYSGQSYDKKLNSIFLYLKKNRADAFFIQNSESLAWLYNIRGADLDYTPIVFCTSLITQNKAYLFFEDNTLPTKIIKYYSKKVIFLNYNKIISVLGKIKKGNYCILLDPNNTSKFNLDLIKKHSNNIKMIQDPIQHYKSIKNSTEIKNSEKAHLLDGVALCKFLFWIKNLKSNITELDIVEKLESLRLLNKNYLGKSFPTIAGSGPNGAIIHYIPNLKSNRKVMKNDILLLDSGGQYKLGTTDITRTIALGMVTKEQKLNYTLVLKGHINLSLAVFPKGITGAYLDYIARSFLWKNEKDFAHGTGHGVGHFLNVHEGPFSISYKNHVNLEAGMVFSNEPGYYKENHYGIRIENLVTTKNAKNNNFLKIDTLTLVPYENNLINKNMLSNDEKSWLVNYNKNIFKKVSPFLSANERNWLDKTCKMI